MIGIYSLARKQLDYCVLGAEENAFIAMSTIQVVVSYNILCIIQTNFKPFCKTHRNVSFRPSKIYYM